MVDMCLCSKLWGRAAAHLNAHTGVFRSYGTRERPVRARYFAGKGWYGFRSDCKRDARQFEAEHHVRTRILCLPMPVKFYFAWFHMEIIRMREQQARRRDVTMRWMHAAGFPADVAELIALHLLGQELSDAELAARVDEHGLL